MNNPRLEYLREKVRRLPKEPGVYLMRDKSGKIIYIGKAKALRNRVSSYFRSVEKHLEKVYKMVENVYDFETIVTDSESKHWYWNAALLNSTLRNIISC